MLYAYGLILVTVGSKPEKWFVYGRFVGCRLVCTFAMPSRRLRCPPAWQAHSLLSRECAWQGDHERIEPECRETVHIVHRRVTPWRELTSYFLLRPGGASLLAQTGRSEQGGD